MFYANVFNPSNRVGTMKHKKKTAPRPKKSFSSHAREATLDEISLQDVGKSFTIKGQVDSISQTSGPTLFLITDGTGSLTMKGFEAPGERAHPDIVEEDLVNVRISINEYNGMLEGEIKSIKKLTPSEAEEFKEKIASIEKERAQPEQTSFLIKDKILTGLKDRFIAAATEIRLAIIQNRPIIVRHHNDADGYSSGFALERAIIPLIEKQHGPGKAAWEYFARAPCAAPFYEIDDSIRDTATSLRNVAKYSNKLPLIVIADNGSSPEDLFAIKQAKVHGMSFVVIDHHFFDEDVISDEVLVHINPFLIGEDGSRFSAGMLCVELARFINKETDIDQIAAMAGLADRIDNEEAINQYLELAKKKGYTKELLFEIAEVIDFVSAKLRFMEAREYIEVLFGEPMDKQKLLVGLMGPYIDGMAKRGLEIAKTAATQEKIGSITLQLLRVEETYPRGFYPKPGKCNGMMHDFTAQTTPALVSAGVLPDVLTIRATDEANFSVHDFIEHLAKNLPESFPDGGGHKNAGAIKFVPSKQKEVLDELRKFVKSRQ